MTHASKPSDAANAWSDIHRSRPDDISQLAYYRYVARRLMRMKDARSPRRG